MGSPDGSPPPSIILRPLRGRGFDRLVPGVFDPGLPSWTPPASSTTFGRLLGLNPGGAQKVPGRVPSTVDGSSTPPGSGFQPPCSWGLRPRATFLDAYGVLPERWPLAGLNPGGAQKVPGRVSSTVDGSSTPPGSGFRPPCSLGLRPRATFLDASGVLPGPLTGCRT